MKYKKETGGPGTRHRHKPRFRVHKSNYILLIDYVVFNAVSAMCPIFNKWNIQHVTLYISFVKNEIYQIGHMYPQALVSNIGHLPY